MTSAREQQLKIDEREAFERFAPLVGYNVLPGSIVQAPPPAPDIQFEDANRGRINVELVALDHRRTRTRLSNMDNTSEAWNRAVDRLTPRDQASVRSEFANAHMSLNFDESAGTRLRTDIFAAIQRDVLSRPGHQGEVFDQLTRPPGLQRAEIHRGKDITDGPHFAAPSAGSGMPPQLNKIAEKLREKNYTATGPLELFAYATHDDPGGAVGGLEEIKATIQAHLPGSRFHRVYVLDWWSRRLIVSIP